MTDEDLLAVVKKNFNFRPGNIIKELDLLRPIYQKTAKYGHFGRNDPDFTWEKPKQLTLWEQPRSLEWDLQINIIIIYSLRY